MPWFVGRMSQLAIETADWLRWNPVARAVLCCHQILRACLSCKRDPGVIANNIRRLSTAARFAPRASWIPAIEQQIHRLTRNLDTARLDWPRLIPRLILFYYLQKASNVLQRLAQKYLPI